LEKYYSALLKTKMKIGILYICTGKYDVFWEGFYSSAEKYLFPDSEKHYFVFTDSDSIHPSDCIHVIYQQRLGWPKDTLMRFHLFLSIEEQLKKMDFLFFFNANYTFIKTIAEEEVLPSLNDNFLVGQIHPVAYHKKRAQYDYETNPASTAYIDTSSGAHYFAGGLIGGRTPEFLQMCRTLKDNIDKDDANGVLAKWHDESHINKYFSGHEPKMLHPGYCYPQDWFLPFEQKTLLLDKNKFGGHGFLRGVESENRFEALKSKLFKAKQYVRAFNYKMFGYSPI
jgi:hypothetical protein